MKKILVFIAGALLAGGVSGQDKSRFVEPKPGYFDQLKKMAEDQKGKFTEKKRVFKADFSSVNPPKENSEFKVIWHQNPVSQGITGTCWCFSTTSFYESEVYRLTGKKVRISELYTVYWEYVEKTVRFIRERGNSFIGEGSESNAVARLYKKYGAVPAESYDGLLPGYSCHDHEAMFSEIEAFLKSVKERNQWNEEFAVETVKSILNHYIGKPPVSVSVGGKLLTPSEYLATELKLKMDDYVEILSLLEKPYWQQVDYPVPDNWWKNSDYYNVPLEDYMAALNQAVEKGYTVSIGGDVSEPGLDGFEGVAFIPSFDIPAANIDENARQFRFSNGTTTDDHGIHLVGYADKDGKRWYLIKDSGSGSRNHPNAPGYFYFREDYVKLKMMGFTVHRSAVKDLLAKFKN